MPHRKRSRDQAESQHSDPKKIHAGTDLSADSTAVAAAAVIDPDGEEQNGEEHQKRYNRRKDTDPAFSAHDTHLHTARKP